jgi:hypothetical protein
VVTAGTVTEFVKELEGGLCGPRWWRRRVVAEMEDGLVSAVESLQENLSDPGEAERRVLDEWGSADLLIAELNEVGARRQTCRVARRILTAVPVLTALWATALFLSPRIFWNSEPALHLLGEDALAAGVLTALVASGIILIRQRGIHPTIRWNLPYSAIGLASCGLLIAVVAAFELLGYRADVAPGSVPWSLYVAPSAVSLGALVRTGVDLLGIARAVRWQSQPVRTSL